MLQRISVRNLGCFGEHECKVDFSEETLLAGPNNSGKSMLLAGMNILRYYLIMGSGFWVTPYYKLQGFEEAVHNHEQNRTIEISVTLREIKRDYVFILRLRSGTNPELQVNNTTIHPGAPEYTGLMKKIWFLSPNRSLIPYQTNVSTTMDPLQPLAPSGSNVINYLLEKWTSRDENWMLTESWLRKIDPDMSMLKTPIRGNQVSLETRFGETDVNVSLQGSGFQSAAAVISAIIFSPKDSTVIIEEPEAFLHPKSQETIVDMINDAVNEHNKQVIFSTHSCNMLLPFFNDCGLESASIKRGAEHNIADPKKFSMWTFDKVSGKVSIKPYPIHEKTFRHFREDFKIIWG